MSSKFLLLGRGGGGIGLANAHHFLDVLADFDHQDLALGVGPREGSQIWLVTQQAANGRFPELLFGQ